MQRAFMKKCIGLYIRSQETRQKGVSLEALDRKQDTKAGVSEIKSCELQWPKTISLAIEEPERVNKTQRSLISQMIAKGERAHAYIPT